MRLSFFIGEVIILQMVLKSNYFLEPYLLRFAVF
jgi:hypothetical protein